MTQSIIQFIFQLGLALAFSRIKITIYTFYVFSDVTSFMYGKYIFNANRSLHFPRWILILKKERYNM
jgi:hypothetical protein